MSNYKNNAQSFVTTAGLASFPHLNVPDTKFNADGIYHVDLILDKTPEVQKLVTSIAKMVKDHMVVTEQEKSGGRKVVEGVSKPYEVQTDSVILKFKLPALIKTKAGKTYEQRPAIFDAGGTPMNPESTIIGRNSVLKIAFEARPYYMAAIGVGVTLRLKAVQVIKLMTAENDAESFGFEIDESFETPSTPDKVVEEKAKPSTEAEGSVDEVPWDF